MTTFQLSTRAAPVFEPTGYSRAARYRCLYRKARGSHLLGGSALPYEASMWPFSEVIPEAEGVARSPHKRNLWFSASPGDRNAKPLQPFVIDFGKAYVRLSSDGVGIGALRARLHAVRYVGDALAEAGSQSLEECTLAVFNRALEMAQAELGEGAAHRTAVQLEFLAIYMGRCRLTKTPVGVWRHMAKFAQPPDGSSGPEFLARAEARLPSAEFLTACARSFQCSTKIKDVIVSSILGLLLCMGVGGRIGEVRRFQEDLRTPTGLIVPGSKGAADHERPVLPTMTEFADQAIARLLAATAGARDIKRAYDRNARRLHLPGHLEYLRDKPHLTMLEAATLMGFEPTYDFHAYVARHKLDLVLRPEHRRGAGSCQSFASVERYLLSKLDEQMRRAGGAASHPLLLINWRSFRSSAGGSPCMFEVVYYETILRSISPPNGRPTMFELQGLDPGGEVRGDTKSLRHLLNTLAGLAELSPEEIAELSGRVGTAFNREYDHVPPEAALDTLDDFARYQEREGSRDGN